MPYKMEDGVAHVRIMEQWTQNRLFYKGSDRLSYMEVADCRTQLLRYNGALVSLI